MLVACLAHPWGTATPPLPVVGTEPATWPKTGRVAQYDSFSLQHFLS